MRPDTWMPLYIADFLADTLHLRREEIGSYLLLIMAYWRLGGPLPDDDKALQQICRCPDQEWARCKGLLVRFFQPAAGQWAHKRIDLELKAASEEYQRQLARTAAARAARQSVTTPVTENVTGNVTMTQPQPQPQPQYTGTVTVTKKDVGANGSRPVTVCDDAWIAVLSKSESYQGIDVRRELGKMRVWCETNRRQPTRRRFVNWLNRCERPIQAKGSKPYSPNLG